MSDTYFRDCTVYSFNISFTKAWRCFAKEPLCNIIFLVESSWVCQLSYVHISCNFYWMYSSLTQQEWVSVSWYQIQSQIPVPGNLSFEAQLVDSRHSVWGAGDTDPSGSLGRFLSLSTEAHFRNDSSPVIQIYWILYLIAFIVANLLLPNL